MNRLLSAVGSIRADERRDACAAFLTLFGFMTGHALLETARDALFLAELPVRLLPWVYLTLAASTLLLTRYHAQIARRFKSRHELNGWLLFAALVTCALWLAIFWAGDWIFYLVYAWTGILATLIVVQFWILLSLRFTVTQAKRIFAVVGSGSVMGAILGSGLARVLSEALAAQHLVLAAGLAFATASFAPLLFTPLPDTGTHRAQQTISAADLKRVGRLVWERSYSRRVALIIVLATVTFTLVDFVFKSTVARFVADEEMAQLFSSVYFSLNLISLLIQLSVVSWVLRYAGVSTALAVVPVLFMLATLGFVAVGGLTAVLLLKGVDGSLRYSLYRTTTELLFVPMSADVRSAVKSFIDVLGQRGGQAVGSLLILVLLSVTTNETLIALFAVLTTVTWIYLAWELTPHYLNLFRQTLNEDITATRIQFPTLDVASLETLLYTLNSSDERRVIAALDLLAAQDKVRVVPGLILYHPSPHVVIHALELFSGHGRDDILPLVDRLLSAPDAGLRATSLRVRTKLLAEEQPLRDALDDAAAPVRVTALASLVAIGWLPIGQARADLETEISRGDRDTLLALARAIESLPTPDFGDLLLTLVARGDTETRLVAVRAMRALADPAFTTALMEVLPNRPLRDEVRSTLTAFGPAALAVLGTSLSDSTLPHAVRRHLPHAIAAFGTPQASSMLLRHLLDEPDGMVRFKILRALGKLRASNPRLPLDPKLIRQAIDQNMHAAFRFMRWRRALERAAPTIPAALADHHEKLAGLLEDKQAHTLERLFRLLNLLANDEDFQRIYRGLHSRRREARAGGRELVEYLVEAPLRRPLRILIDDLYEAAGPSDEEPHGELREYDAVIGELIVSGIESLSSFATYEAGSLRLYAVRSLLANATPLSASHERILRAALASLRQGKQGSAS